MKFGLIILNSKKNALKSDELAGVLKESEIRPIFKISSERRTFSYPPFTIDLDLVPELNYGIGEVELIVSEINQVKKRNRILTCN